ncbi:zinc finger protein JAGGED-like [Andrographis paniculata]|uniref:zinc finger protein JAGGED-like n=1 Tax=Andrographis paniculata TaxID=175694 RepID=UPI0021E9766B|nr:zinc finger protein JAGGED-like [Andrographis paniculata]
MRPGGNPLDLNNFPEDYTTRDAGKQLSEDSSSSTGVYRKKKSSYGGGGGGGGKDGKDEGEKVYECRFCSLKFCKSQALGGHMNRHRQERETETLNKARELVFTNDLAPAAHLGYVSSCQSIPHGGYQQGSMYPTRMYSTSPIIPPPATNPTPPYVYHSPPHIVSQYPVAAGAGAPMNDYFVGHALSGSSSYGSGRSEGNYTCIGAPVGQGMTNSNGGRDMSVLNQEDGGLNWGRR